MLAHGIPEWRVPFITAVADDFGDHRCGKPPRMGRDEQQARPRQQFGMGGAYPCGIDMEAAQQGVATEVVTQRQGRYTVLDVQFPRGAGEVPVAQAVERLAVPRRGENFRAADQVLRRRVFEDKEIIFRAMTLDVFLERGAGIENFFAQPFAIVRQGCDAHQAFTSQLLQPWQVGQLDWTQDQHGDTPVSNDPAV
ncbi:hypothetical protein D3C76_753500 [compost metagenome]